MEIPIEIVKGAFAHTQYETVDEAYRSGKHSFRAGEYLNPQWVREITATLPFRPEEIHLRHYSGRYASFQQDSLPFHWDVRTKLATVSFGASCEFGLQRVTNPHSRSYYASDAESSTRNHLNENTDAVLWVPVHHGDLVLVGPNHEPQWQHGVRNIEGSRYTLVMRSGNWRRNDDNY